VSDVLSKITANIGHKLEYIYSPSPIQIFVDKVSFAIVSTHGQSLRVFGECLSCNCLGLASSRSSSMATIRTALYREFLTPALHRRFTSAAVVILVICYIEAILTGEKSGGSEQTQTKY